MQQKPNIDFLVPRAKDVSKSVYSLCKGERERNIEIMYYFGMGTILLLITPISPI